MEKEDLDKFDILFKKINERIDGSNVEGEVTLNGLELSDMTRRSFAPYNAILNHKVYRDVKKLNRIISRVRLFNKKVPYISSLTPTIQANGEEGLVLTFSYEGRCKGIAVIRKDMSIDFEFMRPEYSVNDTIAVLRKNHLNFLTYFNALDSFALEYPGISFEFGASIDNPNTTLYLNDGFIGAKYDLNRPESNRAVLHNLDDMELSRVRSPKYNGELYDYVDFYNSDILKSFSINEEELSPIFKMIVEKQRKESQEGKRVQRVFRI